MTELNNENKARFFALYWGQEVICAEKRVFKQTPFEWSEDYQEWEQELKPCWVELKPLSQITDEDAIEMARVFFDFSNDLPVNVDRENKGQAWVSLDDQFIDYIMFSDYEVDISGASEYAYRYIEAFDYLRAKSYALPWMGLTVEQMVEHGWIKLL